MVKSSREETLKTVLRVRRALVCQYKIHQGAIMRIRGELAALPYIGHYRPQATVILCAKCGEPLNARERRQHKCLTA